MTVGCPFHERTKRRQARFFRVLRDPRRGGETFKSISKASGLCLSSLRVWAGTKGEPSVMSLTAFELLSEAYPEWIEVLHPTPEEDDD